ncbi:hypothetical protein LguiA_033878 [Lonicera macranthoides]
MQSKVCHEFRHQENRCIKKPKLKQVWKAEEVETGKIQEGKKVVETNVVVPTIASEVVGRGGEKTDGHNKFQGLEMLEIEQAGKENLTHVNFQSEKNRG